MDYSCILYTTFTKIYIEKIAITLINIQYKTVTTQTACHTCLFKKYTKSKKLEDDAVKLLCDILGSATCTVHMTY